ncbi:MAG: TonB-dependent receptor plug domain-containing protein [Candidatus Korobacteraceae bacterium]
MRFQVAPQTMPGTFQFMLIILRYGLVLPLVLTVLLVPCGFGQTAATQDPASEAAPAIPAHSETIVVTGTFEPWPLSESNRSVTSLPVREQTLLFCSMVDFLRLEPSIDLRQRGAWGTQADLSIRGSTFGQSLVLLNGLRINDAQSGHHNLDIPLPLESISRIEVLRGAGSTFHGADAMGGAVNFIAEPSEASELRLRAGGGNFGFNQQRVLGSMVRDGWSETLTLNRDFSTGFRPGRDFRSSSASSQTRLDSAWGATDILLAGSDRPFGADQFYGNFNSWERTKSWFASVGQQLGEKTRVAGAYRRHTDNFILYRDRPQVSANNHISESWQGVARRVETLGRNSNLSYGVDAQGDQIDSNNLGRRGRNRGAGYVNLDLRTVQRFSFSIGAREEIFSGGRSEFLPSIAAGMWLHPSFKLRAGVSRAFRLPTYTDLYYQDPATQGNPNLRPESAWSFEAGADWAPSGRVSAGATFFHRRDRDVIDYIRSVPGQRFQATNIHDLQFTGAEAFLRLRLPRYQQLDVGYTAIHGNQNLQPQITSRYVLNYPTHNLILGWTGSWRDVLVGRARLGVIQRFRRDSYPLLEFSVSRSSGGIRPYFQMLNASNTSYQEIPGVVMPGRSVVGGVELVLPARKP